MKTVTFVKAAAFTLATCVTATSAAADTAIAYVTNVSPVFEVVSNGQTYTKAKNLGNIGISAKLEFDTGSTGRVKSWEAWPEMENAYGIASQVQGLGFYKQHQSYGVGNRPKTLNKTLNFGISVGMIEDNAVGMCNWKAMSLRNQGKSNKQIFAQTHEVTFRVSLRAKVDATLANSNNQIWESAPDKIYKVRCLKWRGAAVDTVGGITSNPETTHGKARAKTTLKAKTKPKRKTLRLKD